MAKLLIFRPLPLGEGSPHRYFSAYGNVLRSFSEGGRIGWGGKNKNAKRTSPPAPNIKDLARAKPLIFGPPPSRGRERQLSRYLRTPSQASKVFGQLGSDGFGQHGRTSIIRMTDEQHRLRSRLAKSGRLPRAEAEMQKMHRRRLAVGGRALHVALPVRLHSFAAQIQTHRLLDAAQSRQELRPAARDRPFRASGWPPARYPGEPMGYTLQARLESALRRHARCAAFPAPDRAWCRSSRNAPWRWDQPEDAGCA